jgi:hypothetical protein
LADAEIAARARLVVDQKALAQRRIQLLGN